MWRTKRRQHPLLTWQEPVDPNLCAIAEFENEFYSKIFGEKILLIHKVASSGECRWSWSIISPSPHLYNKAKQKNRKKSYLKKLKINQIKKWFFMFVSVTNVCLKKWYKVFRKLKIWRQECLFTGWGSRLYSLSVSSTVQLASFSRGINHIIFTEDF